MEQHDFVAGGHRLSASSWGDLDGRRPVVVMLHGGLDCTSTWRDLPQAIAETTRLAVLSYDRWGYGGSDPLTGGRERSYRFEESGPVLGEVLRHFGIANAAGYLSTSTSIQIDHELMRNVLLNGSLTWSTDDYEGIDRTDDRLQASVGGTYLVNRTVGISLAASHFEQSSDGTGGGVDFSVNRLSLSLVAQF